jgi:hypothetical protein
VPTERDAELLRALLADLDPIIVRLVDKIREEIDSFSAVPIEEQHYAAGASVRLLILDLLGEPADVSAREAVAGLGERRAEQGVPVEDVLRAWRIGVDHVIFEARAIAERSDYRPDTVFDLLQAALATADEAMVSLAEGHREADDGAEGVDPERSREAFLLAALGGEAGVSELRNQATSLGLELSAPQRAFRAPRASDGDVAKIRAVLEGGHDGIRGLAMIAAGELVGFASGELPRGAVELLAAGPAVPFEDLPQSFRIAGRVAAAAQAFGMVGVHDIQSAGLQVAVLESPDVGQALIDRFVGPVRESSSGEELLASVREFLNCGGKIDPAAQRLHVHPNTLRYRIGRYEELTGADLTETEQTLGIWWALHRDQLDPAPAG